MAKLCATASAGQSGTDETKGDDKMNREHWTDELDMPVKNEDGTVTDLETGFTYNANGTLRQPRRRPRSQTPSRKAMPIGSADDRAVAKAAIARIKSDGIDSIADELQAYRMPSLVLIAKRLTGRDKFEGKQHALDAILTA